MESKPHHIDGVSRLTSEISGALLVLMAALVGGCAPYSAHTVDHVLLVEDGDWQLREVWRISLQGPLGTTTRDVITTALTPLNVTVPPA